MNSSGHGKQQGLSGHLPVFGPWLARFGKKRVSRSRGGTAAIFFFLISFAFFMVLPMIYTIVTAFKPVSELFLFPPRFMVIHPTLDNFTTMIQLTQSLWVPFSRYLFNSLFISLFGTAAYVVIASFAAFPLAKFNFPGQIFYFNIVIWAILFRPEVTGIPQYIIISALGMINTYLAVLLPVMSGSFGVFLMRQYMVAAIPDDMLEAARIDGASDYRQFWQIVMPLVKPAWLTLVIFTFQSFWNATGVTYIYDEPMKVLPAVLNQITSAGIARAGAGAAVALFLMIPPIIIFLFSQSSIIETMAHSGMKN